MKLSYALPELVSDLEAALVRLGRADLARQLKEVRIARWTYDDFADATYLSFRSSEDAHGERLSLFDELGANVDSDAQGVLCGLEILEGRHVAARLATHGVQNSVDG